MRGVLIVLLVGCSSPPQKPPPEHHLAGCAGVLPGPVCAGPEDAVSVWVALEPGERVTAPAAKALPGGARVTLRGPGTIEVSGRAPLEVRFAPAPKREALDRGRAAYREGRLDDAVVALRAAQHVTGDPSGAAQAAQFLSFVHLGAGALTQAREALGMRPPAVDAGGTATHAYFEGLAAQATGDAARALAAFAAAEGLTNQHDLPLRHYIVMARAMTHLTLGRVAEARAALEGQAAREDLTDCQRADLLTNLGWVRLAGDDVAGTGGILEQAVAAFGRCAIAPPAKRLNAQLNLALWRVRQGQRPEAPALTPDAGPEVRAWRQLLLALSRPEAERAAALDTVAERAAGLPALRWRALIDAGVAWQIKDLRQAEARFRQAEALVDGQALRVPVDAGRGAFSANRGESAARLVEVYLAQGRPEAAMDAARRARRRVLTTLPTPQAIAGLDDAARQRWEGALSRYRAARAALVEDAAKSWERPADEAAAAARDREVQAAALRGLLDEALAALPSPAGRDAPLARPEPGEALLTWTPTPDGGWRVFVQDEAGVATGLVDKDLLAPVRSRLARARRVRVLAVGPSAEAALDLPVPVVYALDLPPRAPTTPGRGAVVVADPTGDLAGARREANLVKDPLEKRGPTHTLVGQAADRHAVREALRTADHLHYAGHGRYAGFEGWDSALMLRDGPLPLRDLLILPRVPRTVVLAACETGRADDTLGAGIGLAHALLIRGAETVIAPTRPIPDQGATGLGQALYAAWRGQTSLRAAFAQIAALPVAAPYRVFIP